MTVGTQVSDGTNLNGNWSLPLIGPQVTVRLGSSRLRPPDRELTCREVAAYYHVHPSTVDYWVKRRWVTYKKFAGIRRFDLAQVKKEVAARFEIRAKTAV